MQSSSGGVSFLGLLFLVFLVLKLTHVIAWSWLFVTMPLWGGAALLLTILAGVGIGAGIYQLVKMAKAKAKKRSRR
jgi:hypothetical protein